MKVHGVATIIAKTADGRLSDSCIVTVIDEEGDNTITVTGVSLDKETLTIQVGDKTNLVATIEPYNATNKNVVWTSSNKNVATINENGIITAISEGNTKIIVTTVEGNFTAICNLTVTKKVNSDDDIYKEEGENKDNSTNDNTTSNEILPNTGTKYIFIVLIAGIVIVGYFYKRNKDYRDIK